MYLRLKLGDMRYFLAPLFQPPSYEFAMLFLPGMLPSVWLWLYAAATLIVRLAARSRPLLRFLIYMLDIDKHPIRSVGIVAAMLLSAGYAVVVAISKFAQAISHEV
jgi:hypothetical protein